jgi:C-terminal processing protease CtpA/Prc
MQMPVRHTRSLVLLLSALLPLTTHAQPRAPRPPTTPESPDPRSVRPARMYINGVAAADRGYLGVTPTTSSGPADTLGLLIDDVDQELAAAKAGIVRGARLVSIDGIDLRLDANDLGDYAAEMLPESRLRRQLGRRSPGDTVTLVVLTDGRRDTKRVVLAESPMARTIRTMSAGRRVLGVGLSQRGSMRDTAGLLITSITSGGAADKAGLNEGDRLVSIDGVDLRVPAADAGTSEGADARVSRMRRHLDALSDSQAVKLDVLSEGRRRTVSIVPTRERGWTFGSARLANLGEDLGQVMRTNFDFSRESGELARVSSDLARVTTRLSRDMQRGLGGGLESRQQIDIDGDMDRSHGEPPRLRGTVRGRTDGATLEIAGLSVAAVDRDFAQQLGLSSEEGALVLRARRDWEPLKVGDVILAVEGKKALDISFDRRRDQRVELMRNKRFEIVIVPANR